MHRDEHYVEGHVRVSADLDGHVYPQVSTPSPLHPMRLLTAHPRARGRAGARACASFDCTHLAELLELALAGFDQLVAVRTIGWPVSIARGRCAWGRLIPLRYLFHSGLDHCARVL